MPGAPVSLDPWCDGCPRRQAPCLAEFAPVEMAFMASFKAEHRRGPAGGEVFRQSGAARPFLRSARRPGRPAPAVPTLVIDVGCSEGDKKAACLRRDAGETPCELERFPFDLAHRNLSSVIFSKANYSAQVSPPERNLL